MYSHQEAIGEDKVNLALKRILEDWNTIPFIAFWRIRVPHLPVETFACLVCGMFIKLCTF